MELSPVVVVSVLALMLFLYSLVSWKKHTNNAKQQPPQPSGSWPFIGHLLLRGRLPHITLGKLADKYGPVFMIKLGVNRALVVSSAEMAKECLGINDKVFSSRPQNSLFSELVAYKSASFALSPYGQYWRDMRKITTTELLSNRRVEMLTDVRISEVRSAIKDLHFSCKKSEISAAGSEFTNIQKWFRDLSLNLVVRVILGKPLKEFYQVEEYNQCVQTFAEFIKLGGEFVPADALPFLRWLDIGGYEKEMKKVAKKIDQYCQKWLEEHKTRRSKGGKEKLDFMDELLGIFETEQENSYEYETDTIIKATCLTVILGAADTTPGTLTWALALLLNNKDVLKKAQAELDTVVGRERQVKESDLNNLVYLQAVLKETMRLYPAGPLSLAREAMTDCTVSGYHIPPGTQLFINIYKIQRDPKVWDNPLAFQPERFLTTHKDCDFRGQNFNLIPFGSGRRMCPGMSFSTYVMQFTLASLLHGFDISTPADETVDMTEHFRQSLTKATPLEVILTHRLPHNLY